MQPRNPAATAAAPAVYTTIPISGSDVISRSFQNLSNFLSTQRPWSEFIASGTFNLPDSLSSASTRLRQNSSHFSINYGIILFICTIASLIASPISMIIYIAVYFLWMVLYFFREDPMVVWGRHVNDLILIGCLVVITLVSFLWIGKASKLLIGFLAGVVVMAIHGVLRNPEGLYVDQRTAAWNGLIDSTTPLIRN